MHRHAQQEAERIDQNVALATADLLARIEALRVERGPPFLRALGTGIMGSIIAHSASIKSLG